MPPNPALGVFLHAVGGFAAGSFYAPLKKVRHWSWESMWLMMGLAAWLVTPWVAAWLTTPQLGQVLAESWSTAPKAVAWAAMFGALWGIAFHEWRGTRPRTRWLVWLGILILIGSTVVIGYGNKLAAPSVTAP